MKKSFSQYVRVGSLDENGIVRFRIDWSEFKCSIYIQKVKYTNLINIGVDQNKRRKRGK